MNVTALILAKNEAANIKDCIKSVSFADEILVIDDNSTDETAEIARQAGAKVIAHALDGDWGGQRTFAISQASCDWIFFIDADERATKKLAQDVCKVVAADDCRYAYRNARLSYFWQQPLRHGGWFPDYVVRLLPKTGTYVTGLVHEQLHHDCIEKDFPQEHYMIHYPYRNWEHYFNKLNFYTTLAARKSREKGKKAHLQDFILHPFWAAFRMYVLRGGWRDGRIGFVLACFHYFYTMAKYVKLYYLTKENKQIVKIK